MGIMVCRQPLLFISQGGQIKSRLVLQCFFLMVMADVEAETVVEVQINKQQHLRDMETHLHFYQLLM